MINSTGLSPKAPNGCPPNHLPIVSNRLNAKMNTSMVQAILKLVFSMNCKNSIFVSVITAGKTMKVTKKTAEIESKNYQATIKLFFIIIRKAFKGETF